MEEKKYRPILFSSEMVKAILDGEKTVTRRVVKERIASQFLSADMSEKYTAEKCESKFGKVGDVMWVRETFCLCQPYGPEDYYFGYMIGDHSSEPASEKYDFSSPGVWKPSIHMPKEACRIFLKITSLSVERLWDINEEESIKEGMPSKEWYQFSNETPRAKFEQLWKKINGDESWESNPWVWRIEFEQVDKPQDFN